MSGNYEANIEVYFKLDESIKEKASDVINICTNDDCHESHMALPKNIKYCSCCGTAIIEKESNVRMETPYAEDFGEQYFDDNFLFTSWNYNDRYWFLQKSIEGTQNFRFDTTSENEFVLSDIDFKSELEIYKSDPLIKSIFAKFDELYGKGNVEIKIGLFPNYN